MNSIANIPDLLSIKFFNVIQIIWMDYKSLKSLKKLWFIIKEVDVFISITDQSSDGTAYSEIKTGKPVLITLRNDLEKSNLWTVLLHEVGHHKESEIKKEHYWKNRNSIKKTISIEKAAWKHALILSKRYQIPINIEYAVDCLSTYENAKSAFLNKELNKETLYLSNRSSKVK